MRKPQLPRSEVIGRPSGWTPASEQDHFMKCPGCGQWFDVRDLGQVLAHVHDAEIELGEGSGPPPREAPRH
jgi:hypothetical protein